MDAETIEMLLKDIMSKPVVACTPGDTAQAAAELMKTHAVGAIPVVSDVLDPLLEGIVTDRDLSNAVIATAGSPELVAVSDAMTRPGYLSAGQHSGVLPRTHAQLPGSPNPGRRPARPVRRHRCAGRHRLICLTARSRRDSARSF